METKTRIATGPVTEEMRNMQVGETLQFPFAKYKPGTIRSTPANALCYERGEGWHWTTHINVEDKCIDVTRVS